MTAEPSQGPVTEGFRSLEVRWIFPGRLENAVAGWFGRFPIEAESREDTYLLEPRLHGLSVKVRGGRSLEVKVYRGGREFWMWRAAPAGAWSPGRSGPFREARSTSTATTNTAATAGWQPVRKRRRISRFSLASGQILARAPGLDQEPRCDVELTEVTTRGQDWWTLGFEASGPANLLRSALDGTAQLVFSHPLPGGAEPGLDESMSYMQWLSQQPRPQGAADA